MTSHENANIFDETNLNKIIDYILTNYHDKHKKDLPDLIILANKVESVHREDPNSPQGLANKLEEMASALGNHMYKEEQVLFPLIKSGQLNFAKMPINVMMQEHIEHQQDLNELESLSKNFNLPDHACGSWRRLYNGVFDLIQDLKNHIELENNILFKAVLDSKGDL